MELRRTFHEQLEDLYVDLLRMSNRCQETVEETRLAFLELDSLKAEAIIDGDEEIDDLRYKLEENGIELIARQAPVAVDLRTIVVIMRLAQHLERVGDLCVNICKATINLAGRATLTPWIKENMDEMFRRSSRILAAAMQAFKDRDPSAVEELNLMDEKVDRINRAFFTGFNKDSEEELDLIIQVVMVSRFVERIADHAVDIGEHVRFLATGEVRD
jgi:phosphate transport system protein